MKSLLQFPCELTAHKTYATKPNVQLSFETQEGLDHDNLASLLSAKGCTGWLVFSPSEQRVKPEDIPEMPVKESISKTPSQRLHSVLFVYYKSLARTDSFDTFYSDYIERVIDSIKAKLPPQE